MTSPLAFWVGTWDVHDSATGDRAGWNEIASILEGHAVLERWRGVSGLQGASLFWNDGASGTWRQVWATSVGWAKQKTMVATDSPGTIRFEGIVTLPDGTRVRDRTTLTPLDDGSVRQVIETAPLGADAWEVGFDAVYTPALSPFGASDSRS
ncbi:MAG: hypothetical protein ACTHKS_14250 [Gaiellaceae bacterium]